MRCTKVIALAAATPLAAVALAFAAGPAQARRVAVSQPTWQFAQGPALAGDRVVWGEEGCRGGCDPTADVFPDRFRVFGSTPGRPQRLARVDGLRTRFEDETSRTESVGFGVSTGRVALLRSRVDRGPGTAVHEQASLELGDLFQPRSPIFTCEGDDPAQAEGESPPLDQDETTLAYDAASCGRPSRLAMRDLATGTTTQNAQPAGSRLLLVRVAGPRVAVLRRLASGATEVAVYRVSTGAQLYTAPTPAGLTAEDVDPQGDGTVAVVSRAGGDRCDGGVLSWYSAASPVEHRVPGVSPCANGVRLAGGRAAVFTESELQSVALNTGETRSLLLLNGVDHPEFRAPAGPVPFFDFDGERAAYALRDCSDNQGLHLTDVASAPDAVSYTRCPLGLRSRRVGKPRRRRLTLAVRCPRGCSGAATIRLGHQRLANTDYFSLGRNRRGRIRLIDEGATGVLRRHRRVRVRIAVRLQDRTGADQKGVVRTGLLSR